MRAKIATTIALAGLVVTAAPAVQAMHEPTWSGPLYALDGAAIDFDTGPIEGSDASYTNGGQAVEYSVVATGLTEGYGYTIWLMVFNFPWNCTGSDGPEGLRCGQMDHLNPASGFSLMYGTGAWAENSTVVFEESRQANSILTRPDDVEVGLGLINPSGAEVHLRVRDHGPPQEGLEEDQIGTIGGGCTLDTAPFGQGERGDYECADIQATAS